MQCLAPQHMQLQEPLHSLLLTMCEEQPGRQLPLQLVLEACWVHQEEGAVHPASASVHIRQLVGLVLGTIPKVSVDLRFPCQEPLATCGS